MTYADVGLGDLFWTAIWVFFLATFICVFIAVVSDLFRDHELSGVAKAIWLVGLVVFPLLGPLAYVIVRGRGMAERAAAQNRMAEEQFAGYVRATAASTAPARSTTWRCWRRCAAAARSTMPSSRP